MEKEKSNKEKFISYVKSNWKDAIIWLFGTIIVLFLTKTSNTIWPDSPVVVKEHSDTVKLIHTISPLPIESDSLLRKQIEQQLLNIELLNKYEKQIEKQLKDVSVEPCKMVVNNPYPKSSGYMPTSSSSFCIIELKHNVPFIDIIYTFIRKDYSDLINTLGVKIYKTDVKDGSRYLVFDQNYEPQVGKNVMLIRLADDISYGEFTIDAGFILKEDKLSEYPHFYRHSFSFKK